MSNQHFLPIRPRYFGAPELDIEPRPGMEPLNEPRNAPHRWDQNKKPNNGKMETQIQIEEKKEPHYTCGDHGEMDYWWFIFGAITLALLLVAVVYDPTNGVKSDWYCQLDFYPLSGDPTFIWLGNAFAALMFGLAAYQMFRYSNQKIIRYGAVFLLVAIYIAMLIWALSVYTTHSLRNALFYIVIGLVLLGGWIMLSFCNVTDNQDIVLPLALGFLWFVYLIYYTWGMIDKNRDKNKDQDK